MKVAAPAIALTPRDIEIVQMVYDCGGCGIAHIHRRLWPPGSAQGACYRRVALLTAARYLRAHRLPALIPQGSGKALITPGTRATTLPLKVDEMQPLARFRRSNEISAFFAEHHFAICDFRVALEQAIDSISGVELDGWILESTLKKSPIRVPNVNSEGANAGTSITLIPDGAFRLRFDGEEQIAYLEMDMGTIAHSRLRQRLRGYLLLNRSVPEPVPLFFVTTSPERVKNIVDAIEEQATDLRCDPTTIFVTCRELVTKNTLLTGAIWRRAGVAHPSAIIAGARSHQQDDDAAAFTQKPVPRRPRSAVA